MAARTGLSVKTIRYDSAIGLLSLTRRSAGGHRRYAHEALEQLRLVQQLRALNPRSLKSPSSPQVNAHSVIW
ncbi:MerR family DNA-binding transcriptional regulator [Streptomyces decoyicus]|uniref:helix-turn-helix domain-containing protein n=1 Tax=Streptomyces decoyicus TaxID=249567 RepID=UPI003407F34B